MLSRKILIGLILFISLNNVSCTSKKKNDNSRSVNQNYGNYPLELINYVQDWSDKLNSSERIADTYVEIDQLAFYDNLQLIKSKIIKPSTKLMVVLKSDAYGHGLELLGKVAEIAGADYIGITENKSILKLKKNNVNTTLMRIRLASNNELTIVHTNPQKFGEVEEMVGNFQMVKHLSEIGKQQKRDIKIHLNLNAGGMSRNGFDMDFPKVKDELKHIFKLKNIKIAGIMTHFPNADAENIDETRNALSKFMEEVSWIISTGNLIREEIILHVANTSTTLRLPKAHLDMVRVGSIIYGEKTEKESPVELKPVMSVYSGVGQILYYPKGSTVGYGSLDTLHIDSYLANIPIGKNNGLPPNIKSALIKGKFFPLTGKMSMNTTMINITGHQNEIQIGDEVVFIGAHGEIEITAEFLWKSTNTWISTIHSNIGQLNYEDRYPKKLDFQNNLN
jgi:amino-acid racemase